MDRTHLLLSVFAGLLLLLLKTPAVHGFFSSAWNENGDTIVLTAHNFDSQVKQHDVLLVLFYVKWCSHCRRMHPDYERAATQLARNTSIPIHLAKLDCTNDGEAQCLQRYKIDGYPTMRIYRHGRFNGEELNFRNRTANEIIRTMKTLKGLSSQTSGVQDEVNHATMTRPPTWLLIGFLSSLSRKFLL